MTIELQINTETFTCVFFFTVNYRYIVQNAIIDAPFFRYRHFSYLYYMPHPQYCTNKKLIPKHGAHTLLMNFHFLHRGRCTSMFFLLPNRRNGIRYELLRAQAVGKLHLHLLNPSHNRTLPPRFHCKIFGLDP